MLEQAKRSFPRPVLKHLHRPKWVSTEREESKLCNEGWIKYEQRHNLPKQKFPMTAYRVRDGKSVLIGDYDALGMVNLDHAEAELAQKLAAGLISLTPVHVAKPTPVIQPREVSNGATRIDVMEDELTLLRQENASLQANIDALFNLIQGQQQPQAETKPKRGRPAKQQPVEA